MLKKLSNLLKPDPDLMIFLTPVSTQTLAAIKNQSEVSIVMFFIGSISYLIILVDSKSKLGQQALKLVEVFSSGMSLFNLFFFIAISFLLFGCCLKCAEMDKKDSHSLSTKVSNIGITGFTSFMIPITSMLIAIGFLILLSLIFFPQTKLVELKINYGIAFYFLILLPVAMILFTGFFSLFSHLTSIIKSRGWIFSYLILLLILWFYSFAQLIK